MEWYIVVSIVSLGICLAGLTWHAIRIIRAGAPVDLAAPAGVTAPAIVYSFSGAMSPAKKESAYLHLPTYTAGIFYHLGTFLAILLFFLALAGIRLPEALNYAVSGFMGISFLCGTGMLVKRITKKGMRELSNPDDYISNALVTAFHLATNLALIYPKLAPAYFLITSLLCLWIPVGKLRHAVFFFAARYHLGFFYGRRGVWPPRNSSTS